MSGNTLDEKKVKRIEELEALVSEYKEQLQAGMQSLSLAPSSSIKLISEIYSPEVSQKMDAFQDEISSLKQDKGMLEKQIASLASQVHELGRALGRGEIDKSNNRV